MKKLKILCFILARGGSKRIPRKNIRKLNGKPLIAYTIECAKRSRHINRIIVSTDDDKIAAVAREYGAETPFKRPASISKSGSTELDAFKHALGWLKKNEKYVPDLIVKLLPTSPFRKTSSVDKAVELLLKHPGADSVRSVRPCGEHPFKMWKLEKGYLHSLIPVNRKPPQAHTLSYQILPEVYVQNASIDVTRPSNVWKKHSITGTKILGFLMGDIESVDINNELDFLLAELLIKKGAHR